MVRKERKRERENERKKREREKERKRERKRERKSDRKMKLQQSHPLGLVRKNPIRRPCCKKTESTQMNGKEFV